LVDGASEAKTFRASDRRSIAAHSVETRQRTFDGTTVFERKRPSKPRDRSGHRNVARPALLDDLESREGLGSIARDDLEGESLKCERRCVAVCLR
jgi:hypothetical protein